MPSSSMAARAAKAVVVVLLGWFSLLSPAPAFADDPVALSRTGQITDRTRALEGREDAVEQALDRLYDERGVQLFVVYVRDFSGRSPQSWADATADRNGLGLDDVLLAVATHDRRFAYSVDDGSRLTDAQLQDVATTAIRPALRRNDWAGAAVGAADGYRAVLAGRPVPTPSVTPGPADPGGADSTAGDLVLPVAAACAAGIAATVAYKRRRKRAATRTTPGGGGGWGQGAPRGREAVPVDELDTKARLLLVETDDAIRTSTEELGFATAQFGEEAAKPFGAALAYAQAELTAAFRLRQELDDAHPEDDPTRRRMLDEIVARCTEAGRRLDAETARFDELRALEKNAPRALEHAEAAFRQVEERTGAANDTLEELRRTYAPTAFATVLGHVEQAEDRLAFAATHLGRARQRIDAGENGGAAVHLRAAEGAVDQAGTFVAAVGRLAEELALAAGKLPDALAESEADLADARGLLAGTGEGVPTADLRGRVARAESVLADVRGRMSAGPYDPLDALRRVEEADAALDAALAGAREREVTDRRSRTLLSQALLTARSAVGAATDFVTTHRGAVGSEARTRLAEAARHLAQAEAGRDEDATAALAAAQRADGLARQAQQLAERDVRGYGNPYGNSYGGGFGGSGGRGGGMGGAVLGGIILGELFGGGGRRGGGYGGGGFGGGGPGSFGGGGTRGRRGGGGRF
ncbi:TPM domain-containing protein [Streptomyces sp. NPDC050732]|uniref:TPM domain-containing protein n=1 Tax=Streptomyces sp. NPDC050732 TaxID=3154632 RepID=UPI00341F704D